VFIAFAGLLGAAAPASADGAGRLSNAVRIVTPLAAQSRGVVVADSEPREGQDSAPAPPADAFNADRPEPPPPAQMRRQKLDDLFARLAASTDVAETNGLVLAIDRLQLDSGSNTSDFLMARAIAAIETRSFQTRWRCSTRSSSCNPAGRRRGTSARRCAISRATTRARWPISRMC